MAITLKKYIYSSDQTMSKLLVRCQCPICECYKVATRYKQALCKECGFEFNFTVKTMADNFGARLKFYSGEEYGSIAY